MPEGTIIKALSGFYYVKCESEIIECRGRGRLRHDNSSPLVGDRVEFSRDAQGKGRVDVILPRRNFFLRPSVANIDVLIAVAAEVNPVTDPFLIDRVTTIAEHKNCRVIICINKSDLLECERLYDIYATTGYTLIRTSAVTGEGMSELRREIEGSVCAFSGNSGVGKSSLLNALAPGLSLAIGEVSDKLGRGRHTTRHVELFDLGGAYIADTPGFASFDVEMMDPVPKDELQRVFPEFAPYIGRCRFDDCAHLREPDCALREAVSAGKVSPSRYASYERLYDISARHRDWENKT
ncbi:MAG: ribosome small subunit-dependent GTPase A [Oscillospiraceae bacterium]